MVSNYNICLTLKGQIFKQFKITFPASFKNMIFDQDLFFCDICQSRHKLNLDLCYAGWTSGLLI